MVNENRVLIFYITEHSGHHSAASAVEKALKLNDPACKVLCVNAFKQIFPVIERLVHVLYLTVIKKVPVIWERMYDNPGFFNKSRFMKNFVNQTGAKKVKDFIDSFKPQVIICTQAFPCGIVAEYKKKFNKKVFLIGVLTDFSPHSYWIYEDVDYYVAPTQESKQMLIQKGVDERKILTFGIPIDPKFNVSCDRARLLKHYGLHSEIPVVLVMGGGRGLGPIKGLLIELDNSRLDLQIIIVCGVNVSLHNWVQGRLFKKKILNFAFTDQIDRLMSMACVVITKPGGVTTAEVLAKKRPMIILNPIPGQEVRNTDFLEKNNVAVKIDSPSQVSGAIEKILKESGDGSNFIASFQHLAKPEASLELSGFILEQIRRNSSL